MFFQSQAHVDVRAAQEKNQRPHSCTHLHRGLIRDADCFAFGQARLYCRLRPWGPHDAPALASENRAYLNEPSPCLSCGACCATYRVSFYWAESIGVLEPWTERLTSHLVCMVGTGRAHPRCAALQGVLGDSAFCSVYAHRPSPCRELEPGDQRCERARTQHGLPPIPEPIRVELPGLAAALAVTPTTPAQAAGNAVLPPTGLPTTGEPGDAVSPLDPGGGLVH